MEKEQSAELCSTLIENWEKEYKRLYVLSSFNEGYNNGEQISPDEMKKYIDNYKKWYEEKASPEETKAKLSIMKRISEAWQLNLDTINKLIKYMESTLTVFAIILICGCRSGLYQIETEANTVEKARVFTYRIVDHLDPKSYSEDYLPVVVNTTKSSGRSEWSMVRSQWSEMLCVLTLGIIPAFYDDFETINVTINTPIGTKSASGTIHAKQWRGWLCLIPYPGIAVMRSDNPTLPSHSMERRLETQIVESLLSQFSQSEYVSFVRKIKEDKAREQLRVHNKKQALELLIKDGRFEEVIKACEDENVESDADNPWAAIRERACADLKKSVPSMNDSKRLISLFSMVNDVAIRDAIVLRLGALCKCSEMGDSTLVKYVMQSSSEEGRLCAIAAISSEKDLISIVKAKCSDSVAVAILKKIGTPDKLRDFVWKKSSNQQLIQAYIEVFGTDKELVLIIERYGLQLNSETIQLIRNKTTTQSVIKAIVGIDAQRQAEKIVEKAGLKFSTVLWDLKVLVPELNKITDRLTLESVAAAVLRRHMEENRGISYPHNDNRRAVDAFTRCLGKDECERLFDSLCDKVKYHNWYNHRGMDWFLLGLLRGMSEDAYKCRLQAAISRAADKLSFEGFYIGMPLKDYYVICNSKGQFPGASAYIRSGVTCLTFYRRVRYKLFEKEDGEFWSAFLRKYVPSKNKSLTETIGNVLDSGSYDYQQVWDSKSEEHCYIYKSIKYNTLVRFGLKSGTLLMKELED